MPTKKSPTSRARKSPARKSPARKSRARKSPIKMYMSSCQMHMERASTVKRVPPPVAPRVRNSDLLKSLTKTRPHGPKRSPPSRGTMRRHHSSSSELSMFFNAEQIRKAQINMLIDNLQDLRSEAYLAPQKEYPKYKRKAETLIRRIQDVYRAAGEEVPVSSDISGEFGFLPWRPEGDVELDPRKGALRRKTRKELEMAAEKFRREGLLPINF